MQRIITSQTHAKAQDVQREYVFIVHFLFMRGEFDQVFFFFFRYYLTQKKTLEINPRHPLIKELLRRVTDDADDKVSKDMAVMMFQTGNANFALQISRLKQIFWIVASSLVMICC